MLVSACSKCLICSLEILKRKILLRDELNLLKEFEGMFFWMDITFVNNYGFVLWFLPTLFFSKIFVQLVSKFISSIFAQCIIIFASFYFSLKINLPFAIDNALNASLFVYAGMIFFKYFSKNFKIIYFFIVLILLIIIFFNIPNLDIANKYYINPFLNITWAVSVVSLLFYTIKKFNPNFFTIKQIGKNSMLLFIIHPYSNNIAHILIEMTSLNFWWLKFITSILILFSIVYMKIKLNSKYIFKYV